MPSKSTTCPACGHPPPVGAKFCNKCGEPLADAVRQPQPSRSAGPSDDPIAVLGNAQACPSCGAPTPEGATTCFKCGKPVLQTGTDAPLHEDPQPVPSKAKDEKVGGCVMWGAGIFFILLGLVVLIAGGIAAGLLLAVLGAGLIPALPFSLKTRAILCGGAVAAMLVFFASVQAVITYSNKQQAPVSQACYRSRGTA